MKDFRFLFEKYLQGKHRPFQPPDEPAVRKAFKHLRGNLFIDIGANVGYYTFRLSSQFKQIYAVEPDSSTLEELTKRLIQKRLNAKVVIWPYKIGRVDDEISLETRSFDSLFFPQKADLVKIDVEGDEFLVLEGMKQSLDNHNVENIMIELHDRTRENELRETLSNYSFQVVKIDDHPRYMARLDY